METGAKNFGNENRIVSCSVRIFFKHAILGSGTIAMTETRESQRTSAEGEVKYTPAPMDTSRQQPVPWNAFTSSGCAPGIPAFHV